MKLRLLLLALGSCLAVACGGAVDEGAAGGSDGPSPSSSTSSLPSRASCFSDPTARVAVRGVQPDLTIDCVQQDGALTVDGRSSGLRTTTLTLKAFHGAGVYAASALWVRSTVVDRPEDTADCDVTVTAPTPLEGAARVKGTFTCAEVHEELADGTSGTTAYTTSGTLDAEVPQG